MALNLPLTNKLSFGINKNTDWRVLKASFGDGYSQRTPDGLNSVVDKWSIIYPHLTGSDITTLETFINSVGSWEYFNWKPLGESKTKKWVITSGVRKQPLPGPAASFSFEIEEVFDL